MATETAIKILDLQRNYNNKLGCEFIPVVQVYSPREYYIGQERELRLNRRDRGRVILVAESSFLLKNMTDTLSLLVFGCPAVDGRKLVAKEYPKEYDQWKQDLTVCLYIWQKTDNDLFEGTGEP